MISSYGDVELYEIDRITIKIHSDAAMEISVQLLPIPTVVKILSRNDF